jgi:uncharacterized protein
MELFWYVIVILLSSALQGVTGFGSALLATPLALLFLDKTTTIISLTLVSVALNGILLWTIRSTVDQRWLLFLFSASLIGLPLKLYLLQIADINILRIMASSISILLSALLFFRLIRVPQAK